MKNSIVISSTPKQLAKLVKASNASMRKEIAKKRKALKDSPGVKWQVNSLRLTLSNDLKAFIAYNDKVLEMHKQIVEWAIEEGDLVSNEVKAAFSL